MPIYVGWSANFQEELYFNLDVNDLVSITYMGEDMEVQPYHGHYPERVLDFRQLHTTTLMPLSQRQQQQRVEELQARQRAEANRRHVELQRTRLHAPDTVRENVALQNQVAPEPTIAQAVASATPGTNSERFSISVDGRTFYVDPGDYNVSRQHFWGPIETDTTVANFLTPEQVAVQQAHDLLEATMREAEAAARATSGMDEYETHILSEAPLTLGRGMREQIREPVPYTRSTGMWQSLIDEQFFWGSSSKKKQEEEAAQKQEAEWLANSPF